VARLLGLNMRFNEAETLPVYYQYRILSYRTRNNIPGKNATAGVRYNPMTKMIIIRR